jgi:hypothetical protein
MQVQQLISQPLPLTLSQSIQRRIPSITVVIRSILDSRIKNMLDSDVPVGNRTYVPMINLR